MKKLTKELRKGDVVSVKVQGGQYPVKEEAVVLCARGTTVMVTTIGYWTEIIDKDDKEIEVLRKDVKWARQEDWLVAEQRGR